jgi:hypothetical protein
MAKQLTYDQVAERKHKAEQFLRDVKDDPERADEVSNESVEAYSDRRHFDIIDNPRRRLNSMANGSQTQQDLLDQISDLQDENDSLQAQLDAIADVLSGLDDDEDGDPDSDSDLDEDDDG